MCRPRRYRPGVTTTDPAPPAAPPPLPKGAIAVFLVSLALLAGVGIATLIATRPPRPFPASNPDQMLDSMAEMVQRGEAGRLVELIEIAPPEDDSIDRDRMGDVYARLGRVLDAAQRLADASADAFPSEIERLRTEMEREGTPSLLASVLGSARGGPNALGMGPGTSPAQRERTSRALSALLVDPYRALERGRDRISTATVNDTTVALLWDNRPILPPLGLIAREQPDGRWNVVPPTSLPMVRRVLPRTESEYAIWGSLLTTAENVLVDLEREVRSGKHASLKDVADSAIEKAIVPMGMVMVAYSRAMRERQGASAP